MPGFAITGAVVRPISRTLSEAVTLASVPPVIDYQRATDQHAKYTEALCTMIPHVKEMEALHDCPDACFVEDPVSVVGSKAVMLPMAHKNRYPEVERFARQLTESKIVSTVDTRMQVHADAATIAESSPLVGSTACAASLIASVDGGDVMWTGQELVIGISSRTSLPGAAALAATHACPTLVVDLGNLQTMNSSTACASSEVLHLKSLVSMLSPNRLVSWGQPIGNHLTALINGFRLWRSLNSSTAGTSGEDSLREGSIFSRLFTPANQEHHNSTGITFFHNDSTPDNDPEMLLDCVGTSSALAANVVSANRFLMRQMEMPLEDSESIDKAAEQDGLSVLTVDMSELAKVDGALTCCSVLFPETRR